LTYLDAFLLKRDQENFVFALNENRGHIAMILIAADKTLFINEAAREKLRSLWSRTDETNLRRLIPLLAGDLADGLPAINGVQVVDRGA